MISAAGEKFENFNQKMINSTNFLEITWTCEKWLMINAAGVFFNFGLVEHFSPSKGFVRYGGSFEGTEIFWHEQTPRGQGPGEPGSCRAIYFKNQLLRSYQASQKHRNSSNFGSSPSTLSFQRICSLRFLVLWTWVILGNWDLLAWSDPRGQGLGEQVWRAPAVPSI